DNGHGVHRLQLADASCGRETIELRHLHVHNDQVGRLRFGLIYRLNAIFSLDHTKPSAFQPGTQQQARVVKIINNENRAWAVGRRAHIEPECRTLGEVGVSLAKARLITKLFSWSRLQWYCNVDRTSGLLGVGGKRTDLNPPS